MTNETVSWSRVPDKTERFDASLLEIVLAFPERWKPTQKQKKASLGLQGITRNPYWCNPDAYYPLALWRSQEIPDQNRPKGHSGIPTAAVPYMYARW